jgi:hypothetical protein
MKAQAQYPLWRVEWTHVNGYQAPYRFVEAKTRREATKLAPSTSRLADFPADWSFRLVKLFEGREY